MNIILFINGIEHPVNTPPSATLLSTLRSLGFHSVKFGDENGLSGADTVLLDGLPVNAGSLLAAQAAGHKIATVEALGEHPEQGWDSVILHLTPITTDLVGDTIEYRQVGFTGTEVGLPVVQVREMSTMVQVNNGEMLIIGGLISSVEGKTEDFAPVVGDIPLVRYLFGVEEKRLEKKELVILLTPRII